MPEPTPHPEIELSDGRPPVGRAELDERAYPARELHDGLGKILTSFSLFASSMDGEWPPGRNAGVADRPLDPPRRRPRVALRPAVDAGVYRIVEEPLTHVMRRAAALTAGRGRGPGDGPLAALQPEAR